MSENVLSIKIPYEQEVVNCFGLSRRLAEEDGQNSVSLGYVIKALEMMAAGHFEREEQEKENKIIISSN